MTLVQLVRCIGCPKMLENVHVSDKQHALCKDCKTYMEQVGSKTCRECKRPFPIRQKYNKDSDCTISTRWLSNRSICVVCKPMEPRNQGREQTAHFKTCNDCKKRQGPGDYASPSDATCLACSGAFIDIQEQIYELKKIACFRRCCNNCGKKLSTTRRERGYFYHMSGDPSIPFLPPKKGTRGEVHEYSKNFSLLCVKCNDLFHEGKQLVLKFKYSCEIPTPLKKIS